ncbi:MAG: spore coat protein [Bacillota bacterium]
MLQDKQMAIDCLEMKKHGAVELTKAAAECSNTQLRQTLMQMRNSCEQAQQEIAQIATTKGWYLPAGNADQQEISRVKGFYQNEVAGVAGAGAPGGMMR